MRANGEKKGRWTWAGAISVHYKLARAYPNKLGRRFWADKPSPKSKLEFYYLFVFIWISADEYFPFCATLGSPFGLWTKECKFRLHCSWTIRPAAWISNLLHWIILRLRPYYYICRRFSLQKPSHHEVVRFIVWFDRPPPPPWKPIPPPPPPPPFQVNFPSPLELLLIFRNIKFPSGHFSCIGFDAIRPFLQLPGAFWRYRLQAALVCGGGRTEGGVGWGGNLLDMVTCLIHHVL